MLTPTPPSDRLGTSALPQSARTLLWLALGALAGTALTVAGMTLYQRSTFAWVEHSRAVFQTTRSALLELSVAENQYLQEIRLGQPPASPPEKARALIAQRLDSVVDLTIDNPSQHAQAVAIQDLERRWVETAVEGPPRADAGHTDHMSAIANAVDSTTQVFLAAETRLYTARLARFEHVQIATMLFVIAEAILVGFVLLLYARRLGEHVGALTEQQYRLEEQATELEEQAAELEVSNQELAESGEMRMVALQEAEAHALERSRLVAQLDAWLDAAPMAVAVLDRELRFVRVNRWWADLTHYSANEHQGKSALDVPFSVDATEAALPFMRRAMDHAMVISNSELNGRSSRDKQTHNWLLSCAPVTVAGVGVTGVAVALHDVTDRTRLAEQFLQSQKMEAIGRLAGGIAHDFNNSLAVIGAYASMIDVSGELVAPNTQHVREIIAAVERAAALTRQLLAFGRRQMTQARPIDVNDAVRRMTPMLARILPATIALETRLDALPSTVTIDSSQLEQVIMNLVTNAAHAMVGAGSLVVETSAAQLDDTYASAHTGVVPGLYVALTITDSGVGMDEETLKHIFEPFFTTKEAGQGSGLGLASVYAIVKNAGGNIWAYSELGKGTTFKIYLPHAIAPVVEAGPSTPRPISGDGARILIVEDDPKLRPLVGLLLEQAGYLSLQAATGEAALAVLQEQADSVDLVLTDLVMPGMSGRELSEVIAKRYPGLPILFTSGYTDDVVIRRGMIERGFPFVQKPFTREQLLDAIGRALVVS